MGYVYTPPGHLHGQICHDLATETTAWRLVDLLVQLNAKLCKDTYMSDEEFDAMEELFEDVTYWADANLTEGLTYDAVQEQLEDIWWHQAYQSQ